MDNIEENNKSKKGLDESDFHQQRLPSWNPIILISTIYPLFGCAGLTFILIGIALLFASMSINERKIDYTNCQEYNASLDSWMNNTCAEVLDRNRTSNFESCSCKVEFDLTKEFRGQVYFYYALTNFYQNHRKYFSSRDDKQLLGKPVTAVTTDCDPYGSFKNGSTVLNYAPCGAIANSLFNDTFELFYVNGTDRLRVNMTSKGIAWRTDTNLLFGKPKDWTNTVKPVNWKLSALERNPDSYQGDEELLVWMRTASLSYFKKLNRIVEHRSNPFLTGLPAGKFHLLINYAYPATIYKGTKMVILSTTNALGGKNHNMGIIYITLGSIHELIFIIFLIFTICKRDPKIFAKKSMKSKGHVNIKDTPLITLPSIPETYGTKEDATPGYVKITSR